MINFIKNFSKIKASNIAKELQIDYCNSRRGVSKKSNVEILTNKIKKNIFTILLMEVLTDDEIEAIKSLEKDILGEAKKETAFLYIDSLDIDNIYIVYKIFKEYLE